MGGHFRGGQGAYEMVMGQALAKLGHHFEPQYRVERWHIDLALPPLALEIERGWTLPHQDSLFAPDTAGGAKYTRLLSLIERGWYVMAMRPPYESGFDLAAQLVIDYLDQIKAGAAAQYVALSQYRNFGEWRRSEGTYADGKLAVVDLWEKPPAKPAPAPGGRKCRLKMCGGAALPGEPHCAYHYPIFAEEERAKRERGR